MAIGGEASRIAAPLAALQRDVIACRACPRLVRWREKVAKEKVRRFAHQEYWGKPIPGFGDSAARRMLTSPAVS